MVVDSAGNSYLAGNFKGSVVVGKQPLLTSATTDYVVVSFTRGGQLRWAVQGGGKSGNWLADIALSARGDVYITGRLGTEPAPGASHARPLEQAAPGQGQAGRPPGAADSVASFVACLHPATGVTRWLTRPAAGAIQFQRLTVDATGAVYVAGVFRRPVARFGTLPPVVNPPAESADQPASRQQLFVTCLDGTTGAWQWVAGAASPGATAHPVVAQALSSTTANATVLRADAANRLFLAGGDDNSSFLACLDARTGVWQWGHEPAGAPQSFINAVALDRAGHLFAAGGEARLNESSLYLARLDAATGTEQWRLPAGSGCPNASLDECAVEISALHFDPQGRLFALGYGQSGVSWPGVKRYGPPAARGSMFVFLLDTATLAAQWLAVAGDPGQLRPTAMGGDRAGELYLSGFATQPVTLEPGGIALQADSTRATGGVFLVSFRPPALQQQPKHLPGLRRH